MDETAQQSYCCPECKDGDHLWEEVMASGWRGIDTHLKPTHERDTDWSIIDTMVNVGCSACDWRGQRRMLVVLGVDGEPLPEIHPLQQTLEVA